MRVYLKYTLRFLYMFLFPEQKKKYSEDNISAREAQRLAEFIAFGPAVFQTARIMLKEGILDLLRDSDNGLTINEIIYHTTLSKYALKCLLEASLSIGIIKIDPTTDRFSISKTGWFLINDQATRVNIDFNHNINYRGWYYLDDALKNGKPEGLKTLGDWDTIYQGLSSLKENEQKSWFAFDHFYSDSSFPQALELVFSNCPKTILDVGGNTGRWALKCVDFDKNVSVTILDLPQQIEMMKANIKGKKGSERINGVGLDLLNENSELPDDTHFDVIWMSQFLDCFSENQIIKIIKKLSSLMSSDSRMFIMETFWDRQRFEAASFCLTLTSLYFTALANGNSKMYHSDDMKILVEAAGLEIESVHDNLGQGHSIMICKLKNNKLPNNESEGN